MRRTPPRSSTSAPWSASRSSSRRTRTTRACGDGRSSSSAAWTSTPWEALLDIGAVPGLSSISNSTSRSGGRPETLEPDVKIMSLSILSPGRPDIFLPLPVEPKAKGVWFTLKEGSPYRLKFTFSVSNNIVSGLRYTNTVWKTGIKVDRAKEMLGTFSPQLEPYTYVTPEDTTPSGMFARGSYSARTKFLDDDRKCYLEINYTFDIRREWPSTS
ncbi:hypothetical protein SORBI_3004G259101 [Sorghum bicolor]|uniref:Rho GDP-dissociation inhibitor 1 n=1 Tax=Sorghum bicolor TaxID=4558 RepID=A0A1Z5RPJ3_SORBI|nr:hypothetical protein SORBI_3004G259101 [Sorghum bicolor]